MALSPSEAAEHLKEIEKTGRRSAEAYEYAQASPQFILWGLIWAAGYAGSDLLSRTQRNYALIGWLWLALVVIGIAGGTLLSHRRYRNADQARWRTIAIRWGMSLLVLYAFAFATMMVMHPANRVAISAFIPLIVATIYAIFGIWKGLRFLYAGIAVAALTLGGWLYLPEHFLLWMALIGGGSLILVGLWLRKI